MYSLKVSHVTKQYAGTLLFKDISFELRPGEVLAITGWNGSGKSTLLRIMAGLVRPSLGKAEMFMEDEPIPKERMASASIATGRSEKVSSSLRSFDP
jgi:ABC-type multidrug transport system ATPase subunit